MSMLKSKAPLKPMPKWKRAEADAEIEGAAEAVLIVEADLEAEGGAEVGEVAVNQDVDDGDFVAEESQATVPDEDIWASDNLRGLGGPGS